MATDPQKERTTADVVANVGPLPDTVLPKTHRMVKAKDGSVFTYLICRPLIGMVLTMYVLTLILSPWNADGSAVLVLS